MQTFEAPLQVVGFVAESDAQVAVHAEMITGHDEDALLFAKPRHQLRRIDWMAVADVDDRSGVRRRVIQKTAVSVEPFGDQRKVAIQNGTGAAEEPFPPGRL